MPSDTEYNNIVADYNFNDQGYTTSGDDYQIYYAFLDNAGANTNLASISYYAGTNWAADFFGTEVSTHVQDAFNAILAPAGTTAYTAYFSDVANIEFNSESDTSSLVQIQIGITTDANSEIPTSAHAATLYDPSNAGQFGDIWLNANSTDSINWSTDTVAPGSEAFYDLIHELGHSLGLLHPSDSAYNNLEFTVMASLEETPMVPGTVLIPGMSSALPYGFQLEDIQAIQSIYGANYSTRDSVSVFGFGQGFGAPGSTTTSEFTYCIWAGGGINVIDASSYSGAATINLNQGQFSSIGYGDAGVGAASNNVSIAYGAIIQNAIGTQGADTFIGNQWNNVLAGSGTGGDNTFYSDQMVSPLDTPGINWSYQAGTALTETADGSLAWDDPNYITPAPNTGPGSMKEDVLIGYGDNNTFYSGIGNNVIDGGYNKLDINAATAAINTSWGDSASPNYWDSAEQFTGTNNISGAALANISDSSANTGNVANYLNLHLDDTSIVAGTSSTGIVVTSGAPDAGGHPEFIVTKGADGADGTDALINIQTIIGTGAHDVFSATPGVGNTVTYQESNGQSLYIFSMGAGNGGTVGINDTSGHGTLDLQSSVGDQLAGINVETTGGSYGGEGFPSGDTVMGIGTTQSFSSGVLGLFVDLTAMAAGTSFSTVEFGGYTINAQAFADYVIANPSAFGSSTSPATVAADVDGGGGSPLPPTAVYGGDGSLTGMVAPGYVSAGAGW